MASLVPSDVVFPCDLPTWNQIADLLRGVLAYCNDQNGTSLALESLSKIPPLLKSNSGARESNEACDVREEEQAGQFQPAVWCLRRLQEQGVEDERQEFMETILPTTIRRALHVRDLKSLWELCVSGQHGGATVLPRKVVACILSCGFLALFPEQKRNSPSKTNTVNLALLHPMLELNCIRVDQLQYLFNYFRELAHDPAGPSGDIVINSRVMTSKHEMTLDEWRRCDLDLCDMQVVAAGNAADEDHVTLQINFVSHSSCSIEEQAYQENVACFSSSPELLVCRIFLTDLAGGDTLIIHGTKPCTAKPRTHPMEIPNSEKLPSDASQKESERSPPNTACVIDITPPAGGCRQYPGLTADHVLRDVNKTFAALCPPPQDLLPWQVDGCYGHRDSYREDSASASEDFHSVTESAGEDVEGATSRVPHAVFSFGQHLSENILNEALQITMDNYHSEQHARAAASREAARDLRHVAPPQSDSDDDDDVTIDGPPDDRVHVTWDPRDDLARCEHMDVEYAGTGAGGTAAAETAAAGTATAGHAGDGTAADVNTTNVGCGAYWNSHSELNHVADVAISGMLNSISHSVAETCDRGYFPKPEARIQEVTSDHVEAGGKSLPADGTGVKVEVTVVQNSDDDGETEIDLDQASGCDLNTPSDGIRADLIPFNDEYPCGINAPPGGRRVPLMEEVDGDMGHMDLPHEGHDQGHLDWPTAGSHGDGFGVDHSALFSNQGNDDVTPGDEDVIRFAEDLATRILSQGIGIAHRGMQTDPSGSGNHLGSGCPYAARGASFGMYRVGMVENLEGVGGKVRGGAAARGRNHGNDSSERDPIRQNVEEDVAFQVASVSSGLLSAIENFVDRSICKAFQSALGDIRVQTAASAKSREMRGDGHSGSGAGGGGVAAMDACVNKEEVERYVEGMVGDTLDSAMFAIKDHVMGMSDGGHRYHSDRALDQEWNAQLFAFVDDFVLNIMEEALFLFKTQYHHAGWKRQYRKRSSADSQTMRQVSMTSSLGGATASAAVGASQSFDSCDASDARYFEAEFSEDGYSRRRTSTMSSSGSRKYLRAESCASSRRGSGDNYSYDDGGGRLAPNRRRSSSGFRDAVLSDFEDELMHSDLSTPSLYMFDGEDSGSVQRRASEPASRCGEDLDFLIRRTSAKKRAVSMDITPSRKMILDLIGSRPSNPSGQSSKKPGSSSTTHLDWFAKDLLVEAFNDAFVELFGAHYEHLKCTEVRRDPNPDPNDLDPERPRGEDAHHPSNGGGGGGGISGAVRRYVTKLSGDILKDAMVQAADGPDQFQDALDIPFSYAEYLADLFARQIIAEALNVLDPRCGPGRPGVLPASTQAVAVGVRESGADSWGDPQLDALIQWLAVSRAGAPVLRYYSQGHPALAEMPRVVDVLKQHRVTIGDLLNLVLEYCEGRRMGTVDGDVLHYVRSRYNA